MTSLLRKFKRLIRWVGLYPPYLGAGIYVHESADDMTRFVVRMKLRWYNRNLIGTHFGGSLFSMTDPFYVFIILANFGTDYIVWDKGASIEFIRPGRGTVEAIFDLSHEELAKMKKEVNQSGKSIFNFDVDIRSLDDGEVVAKVSKSVYVRKKKS